MLRAPEGLIGGAVTARERASVRSLSRRVRTRFTMRRRLWFVRLGPGGVAARLAPTLRRCRTVRDQPWYMEVSAYRRGLETVASRGVLMGCGFCTNFRYMLACCAATRSDAGRLGVSTRQSRMLGTQCLRSAVVDGLGSHRSLRFRQVVSCQNH